MLKAPRAFVDDDAWMSDDACYVKTDMEFTDCRHTHTHTQAVGATNARITEDHRTVQQKDASVKEEALAGKHERQSSLVLLIHGEGQFMSVSLTITR